MGYQKLSRSRLKKIEDERNGNSIDSVGRNRPQTTMSVTRGGRKDGSYSQKKLIADLSELDKRRKNQRPASQLSRRTNSVESGRKKAPEYVNVNNLIQNEYLASGKNTLNPKSGKSPAMRLRENVENLSRLRRHSIEVSEGSNAQKASIERRLRDYSEKV